MVHFVEFPFVLQSYPFRFAVFLNGSRMFLNIQPQKAISAFGRLFGAEFSSNQNPIPFRGKFKTHGIFFGVFGVT